MVMQLVCGEAEIYMGPLTPNLAAFPLYSSASLQNDNVVK